jgi:hypothetical protein
MIFEMFLGCWINCIEYACYRYSNSKTIRLQEYLLEQENGLGNFQYYK